MRQIYAKRITRKNRSKKRRNHKCLREAVEKAAELANEKGLSYLSVTTLSEYLGIRKPSLYNHMKTIEDMHRSLMIYGWQTVSEDVVRGIAFSDEKANLFDYGKNSISLQ